MKAVILAGGLGTRLSEEIVLFWTSKSISVLLPIYYSGLGIMLAATM
jgi:dTDP-glucose pyrophosphorylase